MTMHQSVNRRTFKIVAILAVAIVVIAFWWNLHRGAAPSMPLSDQNGSSRLFATDEAVTLGAISNAFGNGRYRNMMLDQATGRDYLAKGWHPTNGFVLDPVLGQITNVPLNEAKTKWAPYLPVFHIVATPQTSNSTLVIVRTVRSEVIDGQRFGLMGWHHNYRNVPPVRQEEENVLAAIAEELPDARMVK